MPADQAASSFPFLRLPPEIQHAICSELCVHCGYTGRELSVEFFDEMESWIWNRRYLVNLSRVSHAVQALAQPFLYHIFPRQYPGRFLRTIFERPDLANSVKIFEGFGITYTFHQTFHLNLSCIYAGHVDEAQSYVDVARALGFGGDGLNLEHMFGLNAEDQAKSKSQVDHSTRPKFDKYYLERYDKLVTSCVLALCPNLQYACIRESSSIRELLESTHPTSFEFLDTRLKEKGTIGRHGNTFASLERLVVEWPYRHNDQSLGLERLRVVLEAAPNLKRLLLIGGRGKYDSLFSSMPPLASIAIANVRELCLCAFRCSAHLTVPYAAIENAADRCPNLEHFEFHALSYESAWTAPNPFSPVKLLRSLLPAQHSLTSLVLSSRHILLVPERENISIGPILRQFRNLKTLELDEQCFCSHWIDPSDGGHGNDYAGCLIDAVPPTVQRLTVVLHDRFRAIQDIVAFGRHVSVHGSVDLKMLRVAFFHGQLRTKDISLRTSYKPCLADCLYCGCDDTTAMEKLDALVGDAEPMMVAAFKDTGVDVSVYKTHSENMVYHILIFPT